MIGPDNSLIMKTVFKQNGPKAYSVMLSNRSYNYKKSLSMTKEKKAEELVVEPKVMEPYEPIDDNVPRKVAINRKQKEYAQFSLENLMYDEGVDLNTPNGQVEWLNLELFDDNSTDDFSCEEWIQRKVDEDNKTRKLYGKALIKETDGFYNLIKIDIEDYKNGKFIVTPIIMLSLVH